MIYASNRFTIDVSGIWAQGTLFELEPDGNLVQ